MIKKRFRNALLPVETRPGAGIENDHIPVVSQIEIKFKSLKKVKPQVQPEPSLLREDLVLKK